MKYINNYADLAAKNADTGRSTTLSTVSNVNDGTGLIYEGKNILVDKESAEFGDIAVFDKTTNSKRVIKAGTYSAGTLSSNVIPFGVVFRKKGNLVYVAAKDAANKQWAEPYQVKLTGFDFSTGGSFTITVNTTTTGAISYLTSDTLSTTAVKIMAALEAAGFTAATGWTCTAGADHIVVQQNWYTPNVTIFTITDAASKVTRTILTGNYQTTLAETVTPGIGIKAYGNITRVDGSYTYYAGANFPKFLLYYSANGTADTNQVVGATSIIKEANFTTELNPLLVAYYGTYSNYIAAKMARYPYSKNAILDINGKNNTNKLAAVTYTKADGTIGYAYPAAAYAKQYGITIAGLTTGLESGNWYQGSIEEIFHLIKNITMGLSGITTANCDYFNRSMSAVGGTLVRVTDNIWASSEFSSNIAWYFNGTSGLMYITYKSTSFSVRPFIAF